MTTQKDRVLKYLQSGHWLSQIEASNGTIGKPVMRLASRINDLKNEGYDIEVQRIAGKTYCQYRLKPRGVLRQTLGTGEVIETLVYKM